MIETYSNALDLGYFEVKFAFDGLADEHVWKRPADGLLSIGENAGHIAYWQAVKFAGQGGPPQPDPTACNVKSLLIDKRFSYYPTTLVNPPSKEHLEMTASQVYVELLRVHNESVAFFKLLNPDLESRPTGWPPPYTYRDFLTYAPFHIAYHTGQIYSARHLLGESTPDN